jgi:hypothetical protein
MIPYIPFRSSSNNDTNRYHSLFSARKMLQLNNFSDHITFPTRAMPMHIYRTYIRTTYDYDDRIVYEHT